MPPEIQSETDRIFLSFWVIFCLFTHPKNPENQNFQKMKKAPGYFTPVLHLHMCTLNGNHMMYGS